MSYKYYNENYEKFQKSIETANISKQLEQFLSYLPKQAKILDAGCGTGRDSVAMMQKGYNVTSFDASYKMVEIASNNTGKEVILGTFEDIEFENQTFDGIWASASLLHVERKNMLNVFNKLYAFIKDNGYLYVSFKLRDNDFSDGMRDFTCFTQENFESFVSITDFKLVTLDITKDSRVGRDSEMWINAILRK